MKKHLLSLFAILCTAVVAQAQELPLQPTGWNAPSLKTVVIAFLIVFLSSTLMNSPYRIGTILNMTKIATKGRMKR